MGIEEVSALRKDRPPVFDKNRKPNLLLDIVLLLPILFVELFIVVFDAVFYVADVLRSIKMNISKLLHILTHYKPQADITPSKHYPTRYQYIISASTAISYTMERQRLNMLPKDVLYVPEYFQPEQRMNFLSGMAGYEREQLVGKFSELEVSYLTRRP